MCLYKVAAACDAMGTEARPAVIRVRNGYVVDVRQTDHPDGHDAETVDMPETLILPLFVNAHAHLDLTCHGRQPYGGEFTSWLRSVMRQRGTTTALQATEIGLNASYAAGVGYVGDMVHSPSALEKGRRGPHLPGGVCFLECFGQGNRQEAAITQLQDQLAALKSVHGDQVQTGRDHQGADSESVVLGIAPHAPYSAGMDLYAAATALAKVSDYRLTTHLAETRQEIAFVRDATGPLADLLRDLGKWDDSIKATGLHPVEWFEPVLASGPWLLAHCNYLEDHHIEILARYAASVVYCPVASDYFGHHRPDCGQVHRYRELLDAGVNVCLGTDSIICQRFDDAQPLGIGSQMRYLYRRDGFDPATILAMATVHGMKAMGLSPFKTSLRPGAPARWVSVRIDPEDPTPALTQALLNEEPMTLINAAGH